MLCLVAIALASVKVSRTVEKVAIGTGTVTLDSGCSSTDQFGSNDCSLEWGSTHTATVNAKLEKDIVQGSTISIDAKVDSIIPFKASCLACGANCTLTVPIIKKTYTITMPDCPISAESLSKPLTFTLPGSDPVPLKTSATGEATLTDPSGATLAKVSFSATLSKDELAASLEVGQCAKAPYDFCCAVGTPCDCTKGTTAPGQCKPESYLYCCNIGTPCDCSQPPAP